MLDFAIWNKVAAQEPHGKKNFYFPHLASEQQQLQKGCPVSSQAPCHLISCLTPPRHSTAQTLVLFPPWVCNWCAHARACAYLRVHVRVCVRAPIESAAARRGSLLYVCDEYRIGRHGEPGSRRKQKQADRHQGVDRRKS